MQCGRCYGSVYVMHCRSICTNSNHRLLRDSFVKVYGRIRPNSIRPEYVKLLPFTECHAVLKSKCKNTLQKLGFQCFSRVKSVPEFRTMAAADEELGTAGTGLIMYVVIRRDLYTELGWPLGSIITQGCHAATAALWLTRDTEHTQTYCAPHNLDHMHKVVLEVKGAAQLQNLSAKLDEVRVPHKLWVEQPEDFPTCLATAPLPKMDIQEYFKKLQLCKGAKISK
eukprot:jgi/Botrbrau1/18848/Bobra.177_2s0010.1